MSKSWKDSFKKDEKQSYGRAHRKKLEPYHRDSKRQFTKMAMQIALSIA